MPFVHIQILAGRTTEQKRQLLGEVTEAVERALGAPKETIRVILTEVSPDHWAVGGETMAERRAKIAEGGGEP